MQREFLNALPDTTKSVWGWQLASAVIYKGDIQPDIKQAEGRCSGRMRIIINTDKVKVDFEISW
jgi:hypothetical protein